jgi:6-oxocamphor hydrolase
MRQLKFADYVDRYDHIRFDRANGILLVQLHSEGRPLKWGMTPEVELGSCFTDIAADPENEVVILTGSGGAFCAELTPSAADRLEPAVWDKVWSGGRRLLLNLLDVPVPMIAAVNGPALVHAELALLCDIVIASNTAVFQDPSHFLKGVVPADGSHVVWPLLLGPNRGRYFLLTGERLTAEDAKVLGVVAEVVPAPELHDRAYQLAAQIREQPRLTRRYTREALTLPIKRALQADLSYGLALEGLAAGDFWPQGPFIDT